MKIWGQDPSGNKQFLHGKDSGTLAAEAGRKCGLFVRDDEDETVSNDDPSCYNCRYRRWTAQSFECLKVQFSGG